MMKIAALTLLAADALAIHPWNPEGGAAISEDRPEEKALDRGQAAGAEPAPPGEHVWPHVRGRPGSYSSSNVDPIPDFEKSLNWTWHYPENRYDTIVVGGPLIDKDMNIYVAAEDGVHKFDPEGKKLWTYEPTSDIVQVPSLDGDSLYGSAHDGTVFALDLSTGYEKWSRRLAKNTGSDTAYVEANSGIVVVGVEEGKSPIMPGGNRRVLGVNAKSGAPIWEFHPENPVWNMMAMFPGDNTTIFQDFTGGVYCLNLLTGQKKWHTPPPAEFKDSFSDGGLILGPDDTVYTCSNEERGFEGPRSKGALRAYEHITGNLLWSKTLRRPCNSWPAVSQDGKTVVVATGSFPVPGPPKHSEVVAFNAFTGELQWRHELKPWTEEFARDDQSGYKRRSKAGHRPMCMPASFSSPTFGGDGSVFVGHESGHILKIRPTKEDPSKLDVTTFDAGAGFLHSGMAFGAGMMAMTTCESLFVFKSK